jgi:hypothetical protein
VASDSDSEATTVPANKTAAPIQSSAHLTCRIYNVGRQEVATGGAATTTITRRQNSSAYTESKAHMMVLSQENYPLPNTSKGKSSSQSQRIPIWEIFVEASMCGGKVLAREKIASSEGTPPKEMQSALTCRTCTSERTPQRGEISTLGGVDTVTAGHTGVSRRQSD